TPASKACRSTISAARRWTRPWPSSRKSAPAWRTCSADNGDAGMMPSPANRGPGYRLAVVQAATISCLGVVLAAWLQPLPYSDWLYYWDAAGSPSAYQRGGIGVWLLALPKALGLAPHAAALALNVPAVVALLLLVHRYDDSPRQSRAWMVAAYLALLVPFMGIVQLDLVAALAVVAGFIALRATRRPLAVVAFAIAASTKPQYTLVMVAVAFLGLAAHMLPKRWAAGRVVGLQALAALAIGGVLGLGVDMGLRSVADQVESVRGSSAVTLYAGLLVQGRDRKCGYWSEEAAHAAQQDMDKPLATAIVQRLGAEPLTHWLRVVACKVPEIVMPRAYAIG